MRTKRRTRDNPVLIHRVRCEWVREIDCIPSPVSLASTLGAHIGAIRASLASKFKDAWTWATVALSSAMHAILSCRGQIDDLDRQESKTPAGRIQTSRWNLYGARFQKEPVISSSPFGGSCILVLEGTSEAWS